MNLKERGITVGDLLLILIIIISTTFIIKKVNQEKEASYNFEQTEITYYKNI